MPTPAPPSIEQALERVLRVRFARNRHAAGRQDYYGIAVTRIDDALPLLAVDIRFRSGEQYCCLEPDCHFARWKRDDWARIRRALLQLGADAAGRLTLRLRIEVQAGARSGLGMRGVSKLRTIEAPYCYVAGTLLEPDPDAPSNA